MPDQAGSVGVIHVLRGRWALWIAVGVAAAVVVWTAGVLPSLPPLPARGQADPYTGLISMLGDLAARLAGLATLGGLVGIVFVTPAATDGTLTDAGRSLTRWVGRAAQVLSLIHI